MLFGILCDEAIDISNIKIVAIIKKPKMNNMETFNLFRVLYCYLKILTSYFNLYKIHTFYAYIPSIKALNFSRIILRFILSVGVISPRSMVNSSGKSLNFLIFSKLANSF